MKATLKSEGQVILETTDVSLEELPEAATGMPNWRGTILLGEGEYLSPGLYALELADGRSGDIFITYTPSRPGPMTIYFQGAGELTEG